MPRHRARRTKLEAARRLRAASTGTEELGWEILQDRRCLGFKFRRQHPVRGFIVDFYCAELRLVVEVDGGVHDDPERRQYDASRDAILGGLGLQVVRLRNAEASPTRLRNLVENCRRLFFEPPPLHDR